MSDRPRSEDAPQPEPPERPEESGRPARSEVDPVAAADREPDRPVAPPQVPPDPGAPPAPAEPPSRTEHELEHRGPAMLALETGPEGEAPEPAPVDEPAADTEETLALPPATGAGARPSSQPERMPALEGVSVPFAAPPAERNGGRFAATLAVSIGGGVAIVIAVVVALVISLITLTESLMDKIGDTATTFIDDVAAERWDDAYAHLCPGMRDRPVEDYIGEWAEWEADGAEVKPARDEMSGTYVPVELADGSTVKLKIHIDQSAESLDPAVCGWDHED